MPTQRLTQFFVNNLQPEEKEQTYFDTNVIGLGVRIFPSGNASYIFQRKIDGREKKQKIARTSDMKLDAARRRATIWNGQIVDGTNPFSKRIATTRSFDELFALYLSEHSLKLKKQRSYVEDCRLIKNHLGPRLRQISPETLNRDDVIDMHHHVAGALSSLSGTSLSRPDASFRGGKTTANRCVSLLSKVMNFGIDTKRLSRVGNPVQRIPRYEEKPRERFLDATEISRFVGALRECRQKLGENQVVLDAIELLLLTGARSSEISGLRWSEVDFRSKEIVLKDSKTGSRKIPLTSRSLEILKRRQSNSDDGVLYVFANPATNRPYTLRSTWTRVRLCAGLDKAVTPHTLRHTLASQAAIAGLNAFEIMELLGHKSVEVTNRYVKISGSTNRSNAERMSKRYGD
jgi:integrase